LVSNETPLTRQTGEGLFSASERKNHTVTDIRDDRTSLTMGRSIEILLACGARTQERLERPKL